MIVVDFVFGGERDLAFRVVCASVALLSPFIALSLLIDHLAVKGG